MPKPLNIYYNQQPLKVILMAGLLIRLVAVVFSRGFGWIDDQFLVIEIAQSWVDGVDFYNWLPNAEGTNNPKGFSFFYPGLHYLLFLGLERLGMMDPQAKMYVVRLLHALWSILVIKYGYELTLHFSDRKTANRAGWMLAIFWILPFLSVRNLVEFVCVPLLLKGTLMILQDQQGKLLRYSFWAGVLFAIAFSIRFQTALITGGIGLVLLFERRWLNAVYLSLGFLLTVALLQGVVDYLVWGSPFVQLYGYVSYNVSSAGEYTVAPWYHYIVFLLAAMIPPVSIYLLTGFFRSYRKLMIIFLPALLFIVFHSIYPNKQERFMSTVIPFLIIAGLAGWRMIEEGLFNPPFIKKWIRGSWVFFWIVNLVLLVPVSTMYSKKARVEAMSYLSRYENLNHFLIEDSNKNVLRFPPQFYLGKWIRYDALMAKDDFETFRAKDKWQDPRNHPDFVLFITPNNLESRVDQMKTLFPELELETVIEPGMMDQLLHWLNPVNDNQNIYIYRNNAAQPLIGHNIG